MAVVGLALSACQCGPGPVEVDGGAPPEPPPFKRDAGSVVVLPLDASVPWPEYYASEPCPAEAFGTSLDAVDGAAVAEADAGHRFGVCIALRTLRAEALLNGVPETEPVTVQFLAGGFQSELARRPDARGAFEARVMRSRYDILKHQPGGVFPFFEGWFDHGFLDMTKDQQRTLAARAHTLRGAVRFGGVPFTPNGFPPDVWFDAFGLPQWQSSRVTSRSGFYELRLLEGTFGLFLTTPASSLFGTALRQFLVTPTQNVVFDRDQELDVDISTAVLEGSLTIDGEPLPDGLAGPDYVIHYTRPGDLEAAITSHHEGGAATFSAVVPRGQYGTTFNFRGAPHPHLPSQVYGHTLAQAVDLRQDATASLDLSTYWMEGGILIDGVPARPNPNYNWQLYLFGAASATSNRSFLMYEVPLTSASFKLKTFPGRYTAVLSLDDGLAEDLATGYLVLDRFLQVQGHRGLPISIETAVFTGRLTIDGEVPVPGRRVGRFAFRNRKADASQYSWYYRSIIAGEDGTFRVRLPKGEYEVYFTIDRETYPQYASGRYLMLSRVPLEQDFATDLDYATTTISGPLRVGGEVVRDAIGGPEVGLQLLRHDGVEYEWRFEGGAPDYVLRVPRGDYQLDFVILENALEGVAWGTAPMGVKLNVSRPGEPFMNFVR